jgi:hypothetical protein
VVVQKSGAWKSGTDEHHNAAGTTFPEPGHRRFTGTKTISGMKKFLSRFLLAATLLLAGAAVFVYTRLQDRFPGYIVDIQPSRQPPAPLKAGFAAVPITPAVPDTWTDANGDARFVESDGDTWQDGNGNGRFDAVWMAGFQNRRPAQGVHDDLWARAMVLDDGHTRLALVVLDAIGFGHDEVIRVRRMLSETAGVDYVIVTSTHTHEAPDLLGLWGESEYQSGVDPAYMALVRKQAARVVEDAVAALRPAVLRFAEEPAAAADLVMDSRPPMVPDPGMQLLRAVDAETGQPLGTLVQWANHPETTWSGNLLLSSDFPHFLREGMEKGVDVGDSTVVPGLGGICLYVNGSVGGLMTTAPDFGIRDPFRDTVYVVPSFDKARAQGQALALLATRALTDTTGVEQPSDLSEGNILLCARTLELPLDNPLYRLAAGLGVLDRGMSGWFRLRTEVAAWRLGPATFLHHPGELYPEILHGGIAAPAGGDFSLPPQEVPPLRSLMPGTYRFNVGLSNDEIGYVIPESQWDEAAPFTYDFHEAPYGEINSVGPKTAGLLYRQLTEVIDQISR